MTKKTASEIGRMSKRKGKVAEREVANLFTIRKFPARRGKQYSGNEDAPDIVVDAIKEWCQPEVKRVEQLNLLKAWRQAKADAPKKAPLVIHKKNHGMWLATMELNDFISILQIIYDRVDWVNELAEHINDGAALL